MAIGAVGVSANACHCVLRTSYFVLSYPIHSPSPTTPANPHAQPSTPTRGRHFVAKIGAKSLPRTPTTREPESRSFRTKTTPPPCHQLKQVADKESAEADREEPLFENMASAVFLSALADTPFAPGFSRGSGVTTKTPRSARTSRTPRDAARKRRRTNTRWNESIGNPAA